MRHFTRRRPHPATTNHMSTSQCCLADCMHCNSRSLTPPSARIEHTVCVVCQDAIQRSLDGSLMEANEEASLIKQFIPLPCKDSYICHDCLVGVFTHATQSETYWPPIACCTSHPLHNQTFDYPSFLPPDLVQKLRRKADEYQTPHPQRVYCADNSCGAFIPLGNVGPDGAALCVNGCGKITCSGCKTLQSGHHRCEGSKDDEDAVKCAQDDMGCKQCPKCRYVCD